MALKPRTRLFAGQIGKVAYLDRSNAAGDWKLLPFFNFRWGLFATLEFSLAK